MHEMNEDNETSSKIMKRRGEPQKRKPIDVSANNIDNLAGRYAETRDHSDREALLASAYCLVVWSAKRHPANRHEAFDFDDLIGYGTFGLIAAAERFDPSLGFRFSTYARHLIFGAITDGLRRFDPVPRSARRSNEWDVKAWDNIVSIDSEIDGSDGNLIVADTIPAGDSFDPARWTEARAIGDDIASALSDMNPSDADIWVSAFIQGERDESIAKRYERSVRWVQNSIRRSRSRLRRQLGSWAEQYDIRESNETRRGKGRLNTA